MPRDLHLLLENSLRSPARARRAIESLLGDDHVTAEYRYDAALLTSEVVTIAVTHAGPCSLDATWTGDTLHVEVLDTEPELPEPGVRGILSGLELVDRLARRWGVEPAPGGGKVIWFELEPALA